MSQKSEEEVLDELMTFLNSVYDTIYYNGGKEVYRGGGEEDEEIAYLSISADDARSLMDDASAMKSLIIDYQTPRDEKAEESEVEEATEQIVKKKPAKKKAKK